MWGHRWMRSPTKQRQIAWIVLRRQWRVRKRRVMLSNIRIHNCRICVRGRTNVIIVRLITYAKAGATYIRENFNQSHAAMSEANKLDTRKPWRANKLLMQNRLQVKEMLCEEDMKLVWKNRSNLQVEGISSYTRITIRGSGVLKSIWDV